MRAAPRAAGRADAHLTLSRTGPGRVPSRPGTNFPSSTSMVGHSLGLRGVYTDPDALPMREAVALIPPIQESRVVLRLEPKEAKK